MLALFNVHEPMPRSPLHALYAVVTWLASIDFSTTAIGIEGLIARRREPDACQTPSVTRLSAELLQRCEVGSSVTQTALAGDIVILDPFDHHHNLCASKSSSTVLAAFDSVDQRIRRLKTLWFRQVRRASPTLYRTNNPRWSGRHGNGAAERVIEVGRGARGR